MNFNNEEIGKLVEDLIYYSEHKLWATPDDCFFERNRLLELLQVEPARRLGGSEKDLNEILPAITEYALKTELIDKGEELRFETEILGIITPTPTFVSLYFRHLYNESSSFTAMDYLYNLSVNNRYVRLDDIRKNFKWNYNGELGEIVMTVNLAKPEKDNRAVAAERNNKSDGYPKCRLCLENVGFCGTAGVPPRQNLRSIPIRLAKENWHLQYSPYLYLDRHIIALCDEHRPMRIDEKTFRRLLEFVADFPAFFLGSNADLPIVGGSILSHEHYQGGLKVLPIFFAKMYREIIETRDLSVGIMDWYNSVVSVRGRTRSEVKKACCKILAAWENYNNAKLNIISHTGEERHNTVTPIASKKNGIYRIDLILRNNRTDEEHPDGIFHVPKKYQNIKKEGIGLIEAAGLFILPGRLKDEITELLTYAEDGTLTVEKCLKNPLTAKHADMVRAVTERFGSATTVREFLHEIFDYIGKACVEILSATAVFKRDRRGNRAFAEFLSDIFANSDEDDREGN